MNRASAGMLVALALVVAGMAVACDLRPHGATASATGDKADSLYAACVESMLKDTCTAKNDTSALPQSEGVVFVAGVGPIDAQSYRQIRANGESMCEQVRIACRTDGNGAPCRTASALWGAVATTATRPR